MLVLPASDNFPDRLGPTCFTNLTREALEVCFDEISVEPQPQLAVTMRRSSENWALLLSLGAPPVFI